MDSHYDREHLASQLRPRDAKREEWLNNLIDKAEAARAAGQSSITGGADGEPIIAQWKAFDVGVRHLPDDEHGILRISIGGGETPLPLNYCVFRGNHQACIELLRKALKALEQGP